MVQPFEVAWSDQAVQTVLDQVRNGVHVRMAVLFGLLVGTDPETTTGENQ